MAGRIVGEDIEAVRERSRIEDVIGAHVTLRRAGADLVGLCPFHDEKTPSLHVTPARGFYYCFGCGAGGNVFDFLMRVDNLGFAEAVQALADKAGIQLRYEETGPGGTSPERAAPGLRSRILAANQAAAEFFAAQLLTPDALPARQMLDARGFDQDACARFGVGYAPRGGHDLQAALSKRGFRDDELTKANLIRDNGRWDVFQGRVIWPIRDSGGAVLGFGARRLFDDDRMPGKYINTSETPVYKKSSVLYGLDLARVEIGKQGKAVVMEGYTDVMAAHLSGVTTAVASCGTAFGEDHARLLQRLIGAGGERAGEIVFFFDGDAAGQAAALKAFKLSDQFSARTYVATPPDGLDPCDLRLQRGDAAVRDVEGQRIPLPVFVMRAVVNRFDLDRSDGRLAAVRAVASEVLAGVRDRAQVDGYVQDLARFLVGGMEMDEVRGIVRDTLRQLRRGGPDGGRPPGPRPGGALVARAGDALLEASDQAQPLLVMPWPNAADPTLSTERWTCAFMLQCPTYFTTDWNGLTLLDFQHPAYRAIFEIVRTLPFTPAGWAETVYEATTDQTVRRLELELLVIAPLRTPDEDYVNAYTARLQLARLTREIADLKSRLQRMNPLAGGGDHQSLFAELLTMEQQRRDLQRISLGLAE
ncbi:MAG: DNA primase [Actinomycetia bacterium]|nr:DNA primase [Actinomycetes bacterium]